MSLISLFIQGGGEGAHAEDQQLVDYLAQELGEAFTIEYPEFGGLETVDYAAWRQQALPLLQTLPEDTVIIAHSLGGPALLKILAEDQPVSALKALHLVAMPYKCTDGEWGSDDFALDTAFAERLPSIQRATLYHSADDEWVPFAHISRYAEKWPDAIIRPLDGRGHSFTQAPFTELVDALTELQSTSS